MISHELRATVRDVTLSGVLSVLGSLGGVLLAVAYVALKYALRGAGFLVFCWAVIALSWVILTTDAEAHEHTGFKFDGWCCNGNNVNGDCQPIPAASVVYLDNGLVQVTLKPGDHPLVTRLHVFQMPQSDVRWTDNGQNYACLYPEEDTLRCLYLAPPGS